LYETAAFRIERETNIVKIMRNMRDTKILLQKTLMNPDAKFKIAHTGKNLVDIDSHSLYEEEIKEDDEEED